jgi:HEPN superfamily AbiU2-like protein
MSANEGGIIVTKEHLEAFRRECVWLRSLWLHFQTLFEGSDLKRELRATAPAFFADVYRLFEEHLILHICKLTDDVEIKRGRKNLTVKLLLEHSDFSTAPDTLEKLRRLSDSIHRFRKRILSARKWLIAHLDLEAVQLGKPLGAASDAEWNQFWRDLQDFLDLMHWHHGDRTARPGAGMSDAESLLAALRDAELWREQRLRERAKP